MASDKKMIADKTLVLYFTKITIVSFVAFCDPDSIPNLAG